MNLLRVSLTKDIDGTRRGQSRANRFPQRRRTYRQPITQAKTAIERALKSLDHEDSFQIINFSERASKLGPKPVDATPENVRRGLAYLKQLNSDGGAMMIEGIKAALDFPHDPDRLRFVSFMTDGYIGNEAEILKAVHQKIGASRIFSFGVGSSPNRYLLDSMARIGRGAGCLP